MGAVKDGAKLEALERHLLVCSCCLDRAENTEEYVEAMRTAMKRLRAKKR